LKTDFYTLVGGIFGVSPAHFGHILESDAHGKEGELGHRAEVLGEFRFLTPAPSTLMLGHQF
jgi:hypothetical protein